MLQTVSTATLSLSRSLLMTQSSTPTNAIRAAVTYNKLRLDASELGRLDVGIEAAKKTLDYLLLCSFQGK